MTISSLARNGKSGQDEQLARLGKAPGKGMLSPAPVAEGVRRAWLSPGSLTTTDVLTLQRSIGNRATGQLLQRATARPTAQVERKDDSEQNLLQAAPQESAMPTSRYATSIPSLRGQTVQRQAARPRAGGFVALQRMPSGVAGQISRTQQPTIQRAIAPQARKDFAIRYDSLLSRLKVANQLDPNDRQEILDLRLLADQDGGWVAREIPYLHGHLNQLLKLTDGRWMNRVTNTPKPPSTMVKTFKVPEGDYDMTSFATFAPELQGGNDQSGGGQFMNQDMRTKEQNEQQRLALLNIPGTDVTAEARINLVNEEIDRVFQQNQLAMQQQNIAPGRVLSVFLGPEWYFRRPDRPYTRAERNQVIQHMVAISRVYPDMAIMPGTIISADQRVGEWTNLTNTAVVVWNGKLITTIDKGDNCGDTDGLVDPQHFYRAAEGKQRSSLFEIGRIRFALDICVDHHQGRAKQEFLKTYGQKALEKGEGVDVHLVSGAGQHANDKSTTARLGGSVVSSDSTGSGGDLRSVTQAPTKKTELGTTHDMGGTALSESQGQIPQSTMENLQNLPEEARRRAILKKQQELLRPLTVYYQPRML